jgi:hypothetical protein
LAYNYHVVARSVLGCEGLSNNINITVKELPTVTVTANYANICPNGSITASANIMPLGNYGYTWYLDGVAAGFDNELVLNNLPEGRHDIYVKVFPVAGYDGCEVSSVPVDINVFDNPVVTIAADNTLICGSGKATLSVTDVALNTDVRDDSRFTYQWTVSGSIIDGAMENTCTQALEAGQYEFSVRMVQNNNLGCASDWSEPVAVVVMAVEVPAFFSIGCDEESIGAYRIVQVPVTVHSGNPQNYTVTFADAALQSLNYSGNVQNNLIEVHLPLQAGDYRMEIEIDGCKYATTGRVMVDSYALGGAKLIEPSWDNILTVNNNPNVNGGFIFYSYQWYKNDDLIPGATKQYYTEPDGKINGEYYVELRGYAILADGDTINISYVSCPFRPSPVYRSTVYPVPVGQNQSLIFTTSLSLDELAGATLEIYDATGLLQRKITDIYPQMSIPGFNSDGAYFGRLTTKNNGTQNFRFIVVNF